MLELVEKGQALNNIESKPECPRFVGAHARLSDHVLLVGRGMWGGLKSISGGTDANCYLVDCDSESLLVDSGCERDPFRIVANITSSDIAAACVKRLVLTHTHFDHSGGAAMLERSFPGLNCGASAMGARMLDEGNDCLVGYAMMANPALRSYLHPKIDTRFREEDRFNCGAVEFTLVELPGHTPDCIGLLCELGGKRILFSGDAFIGNQGKAKGLIGWLDGLWQSDIYAVMRTLDRIESMDIDIAYPGHGVPLEGKDIIADSIRECRKRIKYLMDLPDLGTLLPILGGRDPSYET